MHIIALCKPNLKHERNEGKHDSSVTSWKSLNFKDKNW